MVRRIGHKGPIAFTGLLGAPHPAAVRSLKGDGAQGRNRTTDTAIFSRMLYQLSYLGAPPARVGVEGRRPYRML